MATKIIAIVAQKGGVGKSTITVQIATILSTFGKKILVVNSDTYQNSAGESLSQRDDSNISCITIPTKNLRRELKREDLVADLINQVHDKQRNITEFREIFGENPEKPDFYK